MSEREAGGSFDYLWEELTPPPVPEQNGFDAFDDNTWDFKPAPVPWYRTKGAAVALFAAGLAAAAIVVSLVLLLLRDSSPVTDDEQPTSVTPTTTATIAPSPSLRVGVPPAPPPPPAAPTQVEAPRQPAYRPTQRPRDTTKKPEIGVTRTPVTRSPISVAPQQRAPRN
ncbi:hypothetical protein [Mycolicibacterium goodii]|uniref:Uncharacterized protein n=1 Tax=Mycolicibacterium goodii TaxID=134601 RepID=A0ABS6HRD2_MYCGD|nr:hypothetical protein [Mycolicibacterium goodii]OKH66169.1 hypothetical protein EB74_04895 [Mycobacterium sp. SWH-M5]MBU8807625.1 hypothetical protein [Mycolicibacterium goodii]MBU8820297.1 hypothetical protein [Mycolicibacterium goodii]MBU8825252.1 hypothetical protein [Mycolicibacterium goodii]MBU8828256.1 hypothetical protein [Mycolicibacterium goodii]